MRVPLYFLVSQISNQTAHMRTMDVQAAHHAGPGVHGVSNRVCADEAVVRNELDLDDNEVVDMIQVVTNDLFGKVWITSSQNKVASRSEAHLLGNVSGKNILSIIPLDVNLSVIRTATTIAREMLTLLSFMYRSFFRTCS